MNFLGILYKSNKLKWIWGFIILLVIFLGVYAIYAVFDVVKTASQKEAVESKTIFERGYFEGQRDAIDGDIRIKKLDNRTYIWLRSPYRDTIKPVQDTIDVFGDYGN